MKKELERWKLFFDATKALFVLSDELNAQDTPNWYYQELFYIKLASFINADTIIYLNKLKAEFGDNIIMIEWLTCIHEGIHTIINNLQEEELVFIQDRRTRAAHMFQDGYEYDPKKPEKIIVRILQEDDTLKPYIYSDAIRHIESVKSKYRNTIEFDKYLDRKLHPLLTNLRHNLNRIYNKIDASSQAEI